MSVAALICDSGRERATAGGDAAVVWVALEHMERTT